MSFVRFKKKNGDVIIVNRESVILLQPHDQGKSSSVVIQFHGAILLDHTYKEAEAILTIT